MCYRQFCVNGSLDLFTSFHSFFFLSAALHIATITQPYTVDCVCMQQLGGTVHVHGIRREEQVSLELDHFRQICKSNI